MTTDPPRLAVWLLRLVLAPERFETIAGDLEEVFRLDVQPHVGPRLARRWYWRQTLSIVGARVLARPLGSRLPAAHQLPHRRDSMQGLRQDIRYAVRTLIKAPVFTLIAVVTLALGIGANTAIFTLVNGLLLKPLPFAEPDELMMVHLLAPDREGGPGVFREMVWSYPKYEVFRDEQQVFSEHALFARREWSLTGNGEPERVRGEIIGARYLTTLGMTPHIGRDFSKNEDRTPGMDGIVMLGHALWQRRFGGDPNVLGQVVRLSAIPYTVVGVLPPGFRGLTGEAEAWIPLMTMTAEGLNQRWSHSYYAVARRKPGVSEEQARAAVTLLGHRVDAAIPDFRGVSKFGAMALSLHDSRVDALIRRSALVLLGAVGFVLLIGCVNLANLILARAATRQREVAIRLAIGATRGRLVRQFLTESLMLAGAGAIAGIGVAYGALRLAGALMPEAGIVAAQSDLWSDSRGHQLDRPRCDNAALHARRHGAHGRALRADTGVARVALRHCHDHEDRRRRVDRAGRARAQPPQPADCRRDGARAGAARRGRADAAEREQPAAHVARLRAGGTGHLPDFAARHAVQQRAFHAVLPRAARTRPRAARRPVGGLRLLSARFRRLQRHGRDVPWQAACGARPGAADRRPLGVA